MKWFYECDIKDELDQLVHFPFAPKLRRKPEKRYAEELSASFLEHQETIDKSIEENARDWRMERIGKVELAILRLAVTELLYLREIPIPVIVTQALELSKKYASEESSSFINGILGAIADARE